MTVAVIFTSRRTEGHGDEYARMSQELVELVHRQPGFLRMTSLRDPATREGITVAWFEDDDAVSAWRENAGHMYAQRRGIETFYEEYELTVATVDREYGWHR